MSYKESTREQLLAYAKTHTVAQSVAVAKKMLESKFHKDEMGFTTHVHGEICETVLEILVQDYIMRNPEETKDWYCSKGLIIKDIDNPNSGYFTELDYTVFTAQRIYAFECKSYGGDKSIVDKCTIRKKAGSKFDVYAQHHRHAEVLARQLRAFRKRAALDKPAYQLVLFNFATGITEDKRTNINKLIMPCLDERNVCNIFDVYREGEMVWNLPQLVEAIKIIERRGAANSKQHLAYVKGLQHRKK